MDELITYWTGFQSEFPKLFQYLVNVLAGLTILIIGFTIARWLRRRLRKSNFGGKHVDATLRPVFASAVFYMILAMTTYAVLRKLGVDPAALLAVFGAAGLAIGLALKDTLSNIASGVMMLVIRPLDVGEYIDTPGFAGTVQEVGIFATTLKTSEGLFTYVPNGQVWNARMTNFSRHHERKLVVDIGVGFGTDLEKAKALLLKVMNDNPRTLYNTAEPECYVMSFGDSSITVSSRCWLPADEWNKHSSNMRIALKRALDDNGIEIPFPQRVVRTKVG